MRKSSEDFQPVPATKAPEMERSVSPASPGKEIMDSSNQAILRKRKKIETVITSDATSLSSKRPRENILPSSSPPRGVGTIVTSKGGSSYGDDNGESRIKTRFSSSLLSSGLPHFVPPNLCSKETKASTEISYLSEAHEATSAFDSGLGNRSTVTTSSIEEEGSTLLHSSGQTSNVARETDTVDVISQTVTQVTDIGRTVKRLGNQNDRQNREKLTVGHRKNDRQNRKKLIVGHRKRERRKSRLGDHHRDGEVMSSLTLAARDVEVDRVSGSKLQDVSCGGRSGKTEITCVVSSGCSSIEAGRMESARCGTDYGCLEFNQWKDSSELELSSCTGVLYANSLGTDLSSCSESMLLGMVNAYKLYQPSEPSRMKGSLQTFSARNSAVDETLSYNEPLTTDKFKGKGKRFAGTPASSPALSKAMSSSASEEETHYSGPTEIKSLGEGSHPLVDGSFEQTGAPTFVLSSGRMSQGEAKRIGKRPPTIDDDFDQYFAHLML